MTSTARLGSGRGAKRILRLALELTFPSELDVTSSVDDEDEAEPRVREVSVEAMAARRPNAEDVQASRTMLVMHTSYSSI